MSLTVLYVHNGLGTGGAERSLAELVTRLPAYGIRPVVACLYRRAQGVERELEEAGVDVRFLPAGAVQRVRALRRLVTTERPHLVHTSIFEADVAGRLASVGGPPVLTSLVNTSYEAVRLAADPNVRAWKLGVAQAVDGWTARRLTDHFHAISEAVRNAAMSALHLPPERITVIPRGRDPGRLGGPSLERRAETRRALSIAGDAEVILNVARQEYQKGQRYLVEAVAQLASDRPRLLLLIAGRQGHATSDLVHQVRRAGLEARVRLLGHRDDVGDVLAAADVFAFPSLFEGLGGALIEAMALQLPIVASDLPAIRELLEPSRNAVLVPSASASALAAALATVLDDPDLRRRFGRRSAALFADRFLVERTTTAMVSLYERLTRSPARTPPAAVAR